MNILDFLQLHNIRWQPVQLRRGTKAPCVVRSNSVKWQPKTSDFYGASCLSEDQLVFRQLHHPAYDHIVIDTSEVQQVDVDSADAIPDLDDVVDSLGPWYKSCTKELPHVFVRLVNKEKYGKRDVSVLSDKIDILNGQWSLAKVNSVVFGHEKEIQPLQDDFLKSYSTKGEGRRIGTVRRKAPEATSTEDDGENISADDGSSPRGTRRRVSTPDELSSADDGGCGDVRSLLDDIDSLLSMLSDDRVDTYQSWVDVGIVLRSVGGGSQQFLDKWLTWSSKSGKFDADVCIAKWDTFRRSEVTIGSLRFWAKQDDPAAYKRFVGDSISRTIAGMTDFEDYNIALSVVYGMFKDTFVAVPTAGGRFEWYEYNGHRYHWMDHTPHKLLIHFSESVADAFRDEWVRCEDMAEDPEVDNKPYYSERAKECMKVAKRLCTNSAKTAILKECTLLFRNDTFVNRLNDNKHLIGFDNGVYDLDTMSFRDGKPEDFITFSTRYDYVADVDDTIRADIMQFKRSIMPNDRMMDYLFCTEAYALNGENWIQNINIQTGQGGNGKGINSVLVQESFGDYFYAPDISLFTKPKSSSGGTSSELAKSHGKRFLLSTEPEAHERLQVSKIKYFTGGDPVQARALYGKPIEFVPQFAITLQMNQIPRLSNHDGGIARRLKFVPFIYKFVANPRALNEKKLDVTLRKRFETKAYAQQHMLILLEYYEKYLKGYRTLVYPPEVEVFTEQYMEEEDVVQMFVQVCCQVTHAQTDKIQSSVLFNHFKHSEYYREEINTATFARKLQELGIKKKKTRGTMIWTGLVFLQPDYEV